MENFFSLQNIDALIPFSFSLDDKAKIKTLFLKELSFEMHKLYGGKIQILPKCPTYDSSWLSLWYTPGISNISTCIRDDNDASFELTCRGSTVAVVSDSTRVLGDGDCTPPGGMGVMEGKAFLMKYLGGVDAIPLCIDSRDSEGKNSPHKIIEFVKMCQHSFAAINLEDISQPNCFKVLDDLQDIDIPVWHDDAQGTACVTLAGLLNALQLVQKKLKDVKIVMLGAGAANSTIARLIIKDGGKAENIIMFDADGSLDTDRDDIKNDPMMYRKWDLCKTTNIDKIKCIEDAIQDADVLIALSTPGPDVVKPEWIAHMAHKAIVFACANPVPEIWPHTAIKAGAFIVGTGRSDFPNQVNNSICFPGILKGVLLVRAKKITDTMAICCAHSLADFAKKRGITPQNILPKMEEVEVFAHTAADVAMQAIKEGLARNIITWQEAYNTSLKDIKNTQECYSLLMTNKNIPSPNPEIIGDVMKRVLKSYK